MTAVGSCSQLTDCNLLSLHLNALIPSSSSPQTRQPARRAFRPTVPSTLSRACPTRPTQTVVALSAASAILFVRSLSVAFLSCSPRLSLCSWGFMTALRLRCGRAQQKQKKHTAVSIRQFTVVASPYFVYRSLCIRIHCTILHPSVFAVPLSMHSFSTYCSISLTVCL